MKPTVFIDGDQGTTGLQILSRLEGRPDISLLTLPDGRRKDPHWRAQAINGCDVAILCLPDAAARQAVAAVTRAQVRIIDASSAHRTDAGWTYGFPEMEPAQSPRIAAATRVSNPGCYPTGAIALLRPLVASGLVPADHLITVHAVSGYSGRGREGVQAHEGPGAASAPAFVVYGLGLSHKHTPEIQAHAGLTQRPVFVPAYGAFRQGIVLTIALHGRLLPDGADAGRMRDCLQSHYAGASLIEVLPRAQSDMLEHLDPQALNGSNRLRLAVFSNPRENQILLAAVFDNLGKGASGAAVQNLDLMLGRH